MAYRAWHNSWQNSRYISWDISWDISWHISWDIWWDSSWHMSTRHPRDISIEVFASRRSFNMVAFTTARLGQRHQQGFSRGNLLKPPREAPSRCPKECPPSSLEKFRRAAPAPITEPYITDLPRRARVAVVRCSASGKLMLLVRQRPHRRPVHTLEVACCVCCVL
jgi:hypothetical protein